MKHIINFIDNMAPLKDYIPAMFEIIYNNMLNINLATIEDKESELWLNNQLKDLNTENIKWILIFGIRM